MRPVIKRWVHAARGCGQSGGTGGGGWGAGFYCVYLHNLHAGSGMGDGTITFHMGPNAHFHTYAGTIPLFCAIMED